MNARLKLLALLLPLCLILLPAALLTFVIRAAAWPFAYLQRVCTRLLQALVRQARVEQDAPDGTDGAPPMPPTKAQQEAARALH